MLAQKVTDKHLADGGRKPRGNAHKVRSQSVAGWGGPARLALRGGLQGRSEGRCCRKQSQPAGGCELRGVGYSWWVFVKRAP